MNNHRRNFIKTLGGTVGYSIIGISPFLSQCGSAGKKEESASATTTEAEDQSAALFFDISLAQWSLHHKLFGDAYKDGWHENLKVDAESVLQGSLDPLDFPAMARNEFGIEAVEYVNVFYYDKADNQKYLDELKKRTDDLGVRNVLIMIDQEGNLGALDDNERVQAVENHHKWVRAAKFLGCHSIRVNARGHGTPDEIKDAAVDGLGRLAEYGQEHEINIIVENHGGISSNGQWLASVIKDVNNPYCGTLPDFGNFCIETKDDVCVDEYDRYKGVRELMPYAKGVSAKTYEFDEQGNAVQTDYMKMMQIVKDAGFSGYVGIEYEGSGLSEEEGIRATKELLLKVGKEIS